MTAGTVVQSRSAELAPNQAKRSMTLAEAIQTPKFMAGLAASATKHLSAEKLLRAVLVQFTRTPKLAECLPLTVMSSVQACSQLGLMPGPLGHAYFVPFRNKDGNYECQLIVGYTGLMTIARRSGEITTIQADVVREGDTFDYSYDLEQKSGVRFRHIPTGDETKEITHAWAFAKFRDGGSQIKVLTRKQIDKVRAMSKAGKFGPWVDHYEAMARKTAIRALMKFLPLTAEAEEHVGIADRSEFNVGDASAMLEDAPPLPAGASSASKTDALIERMAGDGGGDPESDAAMSTASDSPAEKDEGDAGGAPDKPASGLTDDQRGFLASMGGAAKPTNAERFAAAAKKKATGK